MIRRLQEFLEQQGVTYQVNRHAEAYTAQEVAAKSHVSGRYLAKVVIVKRGEGFVMTVLPAACRVSLDRLKEILASEEVALAKEAEFVKLFPDCEPGAMPPFGNLYAVEVYVDEEIAARPEIVFQGGTHRELVTVAYRDFARLVQPKVVEFCAH
ncbi:MAG: aminoacyl-tRNA deacylase [Candidatus Methylomirabilales bacterium]